MNKKTNKYSKRIYCFVKKILIIVLITSITIINLATINAKVNYIFTETSPSAPRNLTGFFDDKSKTINWSWMQPENTGGLEIIMYFAVVYKEGQNPEDSEILPVSPEDMSYSYSVPELGFTYCIKVYASNGNDGEPVTCCVKTPNSSVSPQPPEDNPNPPQEPSNPSDPISVSAVLSEDNEKITIRWQKPINDGESRIIIYTVERSLNNNDYQTINALMEPFNNLEIDDKDITPGTSYCYKVIAFNESGGQSDSLQSVCVNVPSNNIRPPPPGKDPDPPSDPPQESTIPSEPIGVTSVFSEENKRITINWQKPQDDGGTKILGYRLYKKSNVNDQYLLYSNLEAEILTFDDFNYNSGSSYCYKISAINANGEGNQSINACVSIPTDEPLPPPEKETNKQTIPQPPKYLNGSYDPILQCVSLHWHAPDNNGGSNIIEYKVYKVFNGQLSQVGKVTSNYNLIGFTDNNIKNGKYQYYVTAVNSHGESLASNSLIIETF